VVPSNHTGAQTAKRRKAGGRVTSKYAFTGEGQSLEADVGSATVGTGKGKRAQRYTYLKYFQRFEPDAVIQQESQGRASTGSRAQDTDAPSTIRT
jgi:hypothetical protein